MEGERRRHLSLLFLLGGTALGGIACNGADSLSPSKPLPPKVASVRIVADAALQLAPGDSYHLTAVATDTGGAPISGITFAWHSADGSVATVDESGMVTARAPGSAHIIATAEAVSGEALVSVVAPVAGLRIAPGSIHLHPGDTLRVDATMF